MSDGCCKLCRCNWLEHILHTPQLHRFLRHGKGFVAGQDHGLGIGTGGLHPFQQLNAGHPRHFQITNQNLYRFLAKDLLRFHAVCGIQHPVHIKIFQLIERRMAWIASASSSTIRTVVTVFPPFPAVLCRSSAAESRSHVCRRQADFPGELPLCLHIAVPAAVGH